MNIAETLASVSNLEAQEQLETFCAVGEALKSSGDPTHLDSVLALLERCGHQDGYGGFHAFECYLEALPATADLRKKIQDACKRAPNYELLKIIGAFTDYQETKAIWTHLEAHNLFDEHGPSTKRRLCNKAFVKKTLFEFHAEGQGD